MLNLDDCRKRQGRLLEIMHRRKLDAVFVGWPGHVYYFSGVRTHWLQQSGFILRSDGRSCLIADRQAVAASAADERVEYEASWDYTFRPGQPMEVADKAVAWLKDHPARSLAMDASMVGSALALRWEQPQRPLDIEPDLWQLRRRKDPDELALMQKAIHCAEAMYEKARQIIRPGIDELTVYAKLYEAAVLAAGEPFDEYMGNDFSTGGGSPRASRTAQAGRLYILDLGPAYRGYFSDTCRSISIDGKITDAQQKAWEGVIQALRIFESMARPGVRCRDIVQAVQDHYQKTFGAPLSHHVGHGVGLQPHEFPHVDAIWDDVLLEGEVASIEPGVYGPELGGGMRIENTYLITAAGPQNLVNAPMELA